MPHAAGQQGYSSGVTYYQLNSSTTSIPNIDGARGPYIDGFYGVNGTMEYLIMRIETTSTAGTPAWTTSLDSLVSEFKLVVDGEILYDWVSGFAPASGSTNVGRFGYFINQIGGRSLQVPTAVASTSGDCYIAIPVGIVLSGATPRFEITTSFYDMNLCETGSTGNTGRVTYWARFNPNTQRQTRCLSATSFSHGSSLTEQVVARVPVMPGNFTLEMVSIQNASANTQNFGTDGLRILALSQFSMPISLQNWASNALGNGVVGFLAGSSVNSQSYRVDRPGILNIPLYGLKAGDLTMIVSNASGATTRLYHPVMTSPLQGVSESGPRQTVASIGNVQKSIVARTEGSN